MNRRDFIKNAILSDAAISATGFICLDGQCYGSNCETASDGLPYWSESSVCANFVIKVGVGTTTIYPYPQNSRVQPRQNIPTTEAVSHRGVAANPKHAFLQEVHTIIASHYHDDTFGLPQLCQKVGVSRSQLFRKMKSLADIAPSDLIRSHRLNKARMLLESGTVNVAETAWEVGFKDPSYFSKLYQEAFGMPPRATRR